jgi:hypothetical protein
MRLCLCRAGTRPPRYGRVQLHNGAQYTGMNFDVGKRDYLPFIDKPFPKASPLETSREEFARAITDNANISGPFTYR